MLTGGSLNTGLVMFAPNHVLEVVKGYQCSALDLHCLIHLFKPLILGVAQGAFSPPVALQMGVEILCQLFQVWDQVAIGMITLTNWLLGDTQAKMSNEKTFDLVRTLIVCHVLNLNPLHKMVS